MPALTSNFAAIDVNTITAMSYTIPQNQPPAKG
jgi:hypothetical protein